MKRIALWSVTAVIAALGISGCNKNDQANNSNSSSTTQPGNVVERAADKTVDVAKNLGQKTGKALAGATTRASNFAERAAAKFSPSTRSSNTTSSANAGLMLSAVDSAVTDATTKGGFKSLIKDFTGSAQKRMGDYSHIDTSVIDGTLTQIQSDWKAKYGEDFKIPAGLFISSYFVVTDANSTFTSLGTSAVPNGIGMPNATVMGQTDMNQPGGMVTTNGPVGSKIALAVVQQGILGSWKIEPPPSLTAQKLRDNLSRELTAIKDAKNSWPQDRSAAYQMAINRVMSAIADQPL